MDELTEQTKTINHAQCPYQISGGAKIQTLDVCPEAEL
jgi:hypothetical protein